MITSSLLLSALAAVVSAADINIQVGPNGMLKFDPPTATAAPGDNLLFTFNPKNHSVTQSSHDDPCKFLQGGFDSGFMPTDGTSTPPQFVVPVPDSTPIYFYCKQTGHCQKGMVGSVNSPDPAGFLANAIGSGNNTSSATAAWTSPPPPSISTATATVTVGSSVYTTTWASWAGSSGDPTPAAEPATLTISVGGTAGLVYTPPSATAKVGDTVRFLFGAKNHTVTQSTFGSPCVPLAISSNGTKMGFDSGFKPPGNGSEPPMFDVVVNTTEPLWFYCKQATHCQQGMVGGINPPDDPQHNVDMFKEVALHSPNKTATAPGNSTGNSTQTGNGGPSGKQGSGAGRAAVTASMRLGVIAIAVAVFL